MSINSRNQRRGQAVELVAANRLRYLGFDMVLQIATPTKMVRGKRTFCGKAEGDLRAVGPGGISILAECKSRPSHLVFSDLEDHQWRRLDQHRDLGGLSLMCWHNSTAAELFVLPWDVMRAQGFGPGQGIDASWAILNQIQRRQLRGP